MPPPVKGLRLTLTQAVQRVKARSQFVLDLFPPVGQNALSTIIITVSIFQSEMGVLIGWLR